jgi:4-hydroxybenzoate polyprenyltransferase
MKPSEVISHIVLSVSLIASIIMGFYGMSEHGVAPFWVLLTLGGSFVLGFQLMLIITGE